MNNSTFNTIRHIPTVLRAVSEIRNSLSGRDIQNTITNTLESAAGDANDAMSSMVDRSLAKAGLQRQESTLARTAKAVGWLGTGALVVGGAQLASRMSPEDLEQMINDATTLVSRLSSNATTEIDMASNRAVSAATSAASSVADDVFGSFGYEKQRSTGGKALSAAGWVIAGLAAGAAGAYALLEAERQDTGPGDATSDDIAASDITSGDAMFDTTKPDPIREYADKHVAAA